MKIKTALTLALLASSLSLHALVNLGEGRMDLNVQSSLLYDTRITASSDELEDTIFMLRPSMVYTRASKSFAIRASAGVVVYRYFDYSVYDDENFFFDLALNPDAEIKTSRLTVTGDLILNSETRSDENVGGIVTTRNYGLSGKVIYDPNDNYDVVLTASARKEDPDSDILYELDRYNAGLTIVVPWGKERYLNFGGLYQEIQSDRPGAAQSSTIAGFTGISGLVLPKVEGSLMVGMQEHEIDNGPTTTAPYFSGNLVWTQNERASWTLTTSRSFNSTLNGYSSDNSRVDLSVRYQLSRDWSATGAVGYVKSDYTILAGPDREDEEAFARLQLSRQLVRWGRIGFEILVSDRSSDDPDFDYSRIRGGVTFSGNW